MKNGSSHKEHIEGEEVQEGVGESSKYECSSLVIKVIHEVEEVGITQD